MVTPEPRLCSTIHIGVTTATATIFGYVGVGRACARPPH